MKVTVDGVVFAYINEEINVLLIKRTFEPFSGCYALAGGYIGDKESAEVAIFRKISEETNIELNYVEQLYTFSSPDRDPRGRIITIAYMALVNPDGHQLKPNVHASEVKWIPYNRVLNMDLAFDHKQIIMYAYDRLRTKIRWMPIGIEFLERKFTIAELYRLYDVISDGEIDKANFYKQIKKSGLIDTTGEKRKTNTKPAELFTFNMVKYREAEKNGINFKL